MTFICLLVIIGALYYLYTKGNFGSTNRIKCKKTWDNLSTEEKISQREHDFQSLMAKIRDNQKKEGVKERTEEDMDPTERIYAQEVEESLKPGYQNDPEWQALSDRAKETARHNAEVEEANLARME
jgi:hypothetical protein